MPERELIVPTSAPLKNPAAGGSTADIERGDSAAASGDYHRAVEWYARAIEGRPSSDETGQRAVALERLGDLYTTLGDYPRALDYLQRAYSEREETSDFDGMARLLHAIGVLHGTNGELDAAFDYLERSIALFRETGDRLMEVKALRNLGAVALARNDLERALECELRALTVYGALEDNVNAAAAMITIGDIRSRQNDSEAALSCYLRAAEALDGTEENALFAAALLGAGRIYRATGETEAARFALENGLAIAIEIGDRVLRYRFSSELSYVLEEMGDTAGALAHVREYAAIREEFVNEERQRSVAELTMRFDLERTMKEEELRRQHDVMRAVVETQEAERRRIAVELHDGIGQLLAAVRLNLLRLRGMPLETEREEQLARSIGLVERASGDVRGISHSLGSSTLRELGIVAALREVVADMSGSGLRFSLETSGNLDDVPEYVSLGLFRVAQELIANAARHSSASEASMQLVRREASVMMMIEDNGVGYEVGTKKQGMGTKNIETRVSTMNGSVHFDSRPGHGTTVTVEVPVPVAA